MRKEKKGFSDGLISKKNIYIFLAFSLKTSLKGIPYYSLDIEIKELLNVIDVLKRSIKRIPYNSFDIEITLVKELLSVMDVFLKTSFKTLTLRRGSDIEITIC